VVAGLDAGDVRADGLDDTGSLVAEDAGQRERQAAARRPEVRVAQARGHDSDQGLVGAGLVELHVGEGEGRASGLDHGCASGGGHTAATGEGGGGVRVGRRRG
jgi:hypothetical protein